METYRLFPTAQPIAHLGCWQSSLVEYSEVLGYTLLGSIFIRHASDRICVLIPFTGQIIAMGCTTLPELQALLTDQTIEEDALRPSHLIAIAALIGAPEHEQVYIPCPYPFLGGSCEPETYERGDLWVFWELVGQSHGLSDDSD